MMSDKVTVMRGPAMGVLVMLVLAAVLAVIAFTTPAWCVNSRNHHFEGLLESCVCAANNQDPPKWFIFSQVASVVILVAMQVAAMMAWDHYYSQCLSKNTSILALAVISFTSVIHMIVIFATYGVKRNGLDWSYGLTVAASALFLIAGSMGVVQRVRIHMAERQIEYYQDVEK